MPYPVWYAAPLFEVTDPRPSRQWICAYHAPSEATAGGLLILSFPEWASDRYFYNDLVEGRPDAVEAYSRFMGRIQEEEREASEEEGDP